ncbi:unnamed protein product [Prorocentrum cordatum]|uniref:Uncharacterized protein n=1 Tax=Prorocentrum cordatum TaxID=2364126 RepID=A0ABN9SCQ4_9DINO|nr:unnamed protein product [Polarella glacialis]
MFFRYTSSFGDNICIFCSAVITFLVCFVVVKHGACKVVKSWLSGIACYPHLWCNGSVPLSRVRDAPCQSSVSGQSTVTAQITVACQDMERVRNVSGQGNVTGQIAEIGQSTVTGQDMERVPYVTGQSPRAWPRPLTVFYHVFQSNGGDEAEALTTSVVKEQLSTMRSSNAFGHGVNLMWTFIGPNDSGVTTLLECPTCRLLESSRTGNEILTLQHLYDYCSKHNSERVVYMHSKGTFHPGRFNDNIRGFLMKGIWSDACHSQDMFETCTACGSRFSPMPHHHYPGNMWLARCDYVARLIPPLTFESAMASAVRTAVEKGVLSGADPPYFGLGRFSAEHWLSSHPSHAPCDVCGNPRYTFKLRANPAFTRGPPPVKWAPELRAHPRPDMPLSAFCMLCGKGRTICNLTELRLWRLAEWQLLYPEAPSREGALREYYRAGEGTCRR